MEDSYWTNAEKAKEREGLIAAERVEETELLLSARLAWKQLNLTSAQTWLWGTRRRHSPQDIQLGGTPFVVVVHNNLFSFDASPDMSHLLCKDQAPQ